MVDDALSPFDMEMSAEAFNLCDALETHLETLQWEQEQKTADLSTVAVKSGLDDLESSPCHLKEYRKNQHSNFGHSNNGTNRDAWRTKHSISKPAAKPKTSRASKKQEQRPLLADSHPSKTLGCPTLKGREPLSSESSNLACDERI